MIQLLEACKADKPPAMGKWGSLPMNGQVSCEGPLGKTSLFDPISDPAALFRKDDMSPKVFFCSFLFFY
jgi:NADH dehydrogenase (ubiquinone) flavoprotein 2